MFKISHYVYALRLVYVLRLCCIVTVLTFVYGPVQSQSFHPYFTHINTDQGLSHQKVNSIIQDQRGFMWFGTEDGLVRFDGRYCTVFRNVPKNQSSLSGNVISDLFEDRAGILWIATRDGGITRYDYRAAPAKQFKQYKHDISNDASIPENWINKITDDGHGHMWLATSLHGLYRMDKKTGKFDKPVKRGPTSIIALSKVEHDILWAGREGGGLLKVNTKTLQYEQDERYIDLYAKLPHNTVTAIFHDRYYAYWLGSWDKKVYRYEPGKIGMGSVPKVPAKFPKDEIVSFAEDNHGHIWMAGRNSGLTVYDYDSGEISMLRHRPFVHGSLSSDHANVVYVDRSGIVWVGTDNGLNKYNPLFAPFAKNMLPKTGKESSTIYDFYKDEEATLWIGTSEGIFTKKAGQSTYTHLPLFYKSQKLAVSKFFKDEDGTFYLGTDYTLFKYDAVKHKIEPLPNTDLDPVMRKLFSSRIVSIIRDTIKGNPVLLVSPYGHYITYYDLRNQRWISRSDKSRQLLKTYQIKDNLVRKIYAGSDGTTWLANNRLGLGKWHGKSAAPVKYFTNDIHNAHSISSDNVYDVLETAKGDFWVSTYGGGLNYFNYARQQFSHVSGSSNLIEGLASDEKGNVWMICDGQINKYEVASKIYSSYEVPYLQSSDGLKGYIYKDNDNNLYAAGPNYYISFHPSKVRPIVPDPEVYLTDFRIFNTSYSHWLNARSIVLDYSQNFFSLQFSAPEYTGDNVTYSYMLEGVDKSWINAGKRNEVNYSNLSGGTYKFKVKATNWSNTGSTKYKSILIVITPPFWMRWWFPVIIAILAIFVVYLVYQYRVNSLLEQQAIRNEIAQDLHDQIGSTLSSISVYSEVAKIYQQQEKEQQLDSVLDTISKTANEMISDMADIVWAINPKNDNLNSIMTRIENFARPLCAVKDINLIVDFDARTQGNLATSWIRKNLYLILKEVINNAIKHANCRTLEVEVNVIDDVLYARIMDDGKGFDTKVDYSGDLTGSMGGNGMNNIRLRAEELKAQLSIDSVPRAGTSVSLAVRLK